MFDGYDIINRGLLIAVSGCWFALVLAPRIAWARRTIQSDVVPLVIGAIYACLLLPHAGSLFHGAFSLDSIHAAFEHRPVLLAGWIHYLAFDLMVGRIIVLDAEKKHVRYPIVLTSLFLTCMFGPLGYLFYKASTFFADRFGGAPSDSREEVANANPIPSVLTMLRAQPFATASIVALLFVAVASIVGGAMAPSLQVGGVSAWLKPFKFGASGALFVASLIYCSGLLEGEARRLIKHVKIVSWLLALEVLVIGIQAARGVTSHFNMSTPLDALLFLQMGVSIHYLTVVDVLVLRALMKQTSMLPTFALSMKLGLAITTLGLLVAFAMLLPTSTQLTTIIAGKVPLTLGAHSVGVPDGGRVLPFFGFSAEGGDLRIPHFLGLHGVQVIPLLALTLRKFRLSIASQHAVIRFAAAGYAGIVMLTFVQALSGESIAHPSHHFLLAAGLIATTTVACVGREWFRRSPSKTLFLPSSACNTST